MIVLPVGHGQFICFLTSDIGEKTDVPRTRKASPVVMIYCKLMDIMRYISSVLSHFLIQVRSDTCLSLGHKLPLLIRLNDIISK